MLRIVPSGWDPLGFAGMGVSWLPPGRDSTDSGVAADWECAGMATATAEDMLMRLSVITHLHEVVAFIGSL
jgi:hypothetical protein